MLVYTRCMLVWLAIHLVHAASRTRISPLCTWQVCPSSDPLDSKDFNPIDYINQLFPTEQVIRSQTVRRNGLETHAVIGVSLLTSLAGQPT